MRALLVCSSGGHLIQLHKLKPWWERHDRLWVTFEKLDSTSLLAGERVAWAHHPTTRNLPNLIRNTRLAWRLLRSHRPDVVVTSGAGVAFPFFLLAKLLGRRTVYVELYDPIDSPTMTGGSATPSATCSCSRGSCCATCTCWSGSAGPPSTGPRRRRRRWSG